MSYIATIRSSKSKFLLTKGQAIWYDFYQYPDGAKWIVRYSNRYYLIIHDGTGNQFFHSHEPEEISEKEAKQILSKYPRAWEKAMDLFGWESLDEYLEKYFTKK